MITKINNNGFSDAYHPAKKCTEWWYFTFFFRQRNVVSGIFKIENNIPEIWVFIQRKGGKSAYERRKFKRADFSASTDHCDVRIGANYFRERRGVYEVKIDFGDLKLTGSFKKNFDWSDNVVARDLGRGNKIYWIVPCVRGHFSGQLEVGGVAEKISGAAFHDHVWHNFTATGMYRNFRYWLWGINYDEKGFCLYADVDLGRRGGFKFVFFSKGKKRLKIVDDPDLIIKKDKQLKEIFISYQGKLLHKIKLTEKAPIFGWGSGRLVKFIVHRILGLSQYHCLETSPVQPGHRHYLEILQKR